MAQSLYDILGIDKNANQAEIKAAHRKLSKKYHPDLQGNKSENEKKVAEDKRAFEVKTFINDLYNKITNKERCFIYRWQHKLRTEFL